MKLSKVIIEVKRWEYQDQIHFLEKIPLLITIAIRDVWLDDKASDAEKVEAMKWINEFNHRLLNTMFSFKSEPKDDAIQAVYDNVLYYARQDDITKGCLGWVMVAAYKRTCKSSNSSEK